MRLRSDQLKKFADEAGASVEALAEAVRPLGLPGSKAESAVRNWLAGRPKPSCKAAHIRALARVVNAEPRDIARFVSEVRFHRGSTQKARLVADLIRGKSVDDALNLLNFSQKRASDNMSKALNAAIEEKRMIPHRNIKCRRCITRHGWATIKYAADRIHVMKSPRS